MFRFLFKLVLLLVAAALIYGLWLLYRDKSPEEKAEIQEGVARTVRQAGRAVGEAGQRVVEKGREVYESRRAGEGE